MPRVDVFATEEHYLDHLAPVWRALPMEHRGRVITPEGLEPYAVAHGMIGHDESAKRTHVLVAGWIDARSVYMWDNLVLMEHGIGQTYDPPTPAYAGGGIERAETRLFLCPNQRVADLNAADGETIVVGDPYLDQLEADLARPQVPQLFDAMFSWHWNCDIWPETLNAWPHYRGELIRLRHGSDTTIAGTSHPRGWHELRRWYKQNDIYSVHSLSIAIQLGRVFVCDNSSALFYAAALGRPTVVLDAPWYRQNVEHGLRFWEYADVGVRISQPYELAEAIHEAASVPQALQDRSRAISADLFPYRDGQSAMRAADAICAIF